VAARAPRQDLVRRVIGAPPLDEKARSAALADEGPGWKDWFYESFLKVWIPFGFFVVDVWIVASWLEYDIAIAPAFIVLSLIPAVYLEVLAFEVLYYEPPAFSHSARANRWAAWIHPVPWGRWTRFGIAARKGTPIAVPEAAPDPKEFL
jgi:hypothetical protein